MADTKQQPAVAPPSEAVRGSSMHTNFETGGTVRTPPRPTPHKPKGADRRQQLAADRALALGLFQQHLDKAKGPTQ